MLVDWYVSEVKTAKSSYVIAPLSGSFFASPLDWALLNAK
jgi:hypothetical protein